MYPGTSHSRGNYAVHQLTRKAGRQAPGVGRQATQGSADCQHWAALKAGGARPFCASFLPVSPIKLMSTTYCTPGLWARVARPHEQPSFPAHFFIPTEKPHRAGGWPDGSEHRLWSTTRLPAGVDRCDEADGIPLRRRCCARLLHSAWLAWLAHGFRGRGIPRFCRAARTATSAGAVLAGWPLSLHSSIS